MYQMSKRDQIEHEEIVDTLCLISSAEFFVRGTGMNWDSLIVTLVQLQEQLQLLESQPQLVTRTKLLDGSK